MKKSTEQTPKVKTNKLNKAEPVIVLGICGTFTLGLAAVGAMRFLGGMSEQQREIVAVVAVALLGYLIVKSLRQLSK